MDDSSWTPPPPPRLPHKSEGRRALMIVLIVFGAFALAIGGCATVAVLALNNAASDLKLGPPFSFNDLPPDVKPIPISTRACPALRSVRDAAGRAGSLWLSTSSSFHDGHDPDAAEYGKALLQFDAALHAAIPQVPEPIAADFLRTLEQVQFGERELTNPTSGNNYFSRTVDAVTTGNNSLGFALARVGNACGSLAPQLFATPSSTIGG